MVIKIRLIDIYGRKYSRNRQVGSIRNITINNLQGSQPIEYALNINSMIRTLVKDFS